MKKLLDKLRRSFILRASVIYVVFAWFVIESVVFAISRAVIPEAALITAAILTVAYFPIVLQVSWWKNRLTNSYFFPPLAS